MVLSVIVAPDDIGAAASKASKAESLLGKACTFSKSIAVSSVENVKNIVTLPGRALDDLGSKFTDLRTALSQGNGLRYAFADADKICHDRYTQWINGEMSEGAADAEIKLGKADLDALRKKWNVPERNTIAVGKTDVAGLDDITFEGGSPAVRKEAGFENYDISNPNRAVKSSGKIPSATRHAEEVVANEFVEAVEKAGIKSEDVVRTLRIHQSNPSGVCPTCLSGLGNPNKAVESKIS